MIGSVLTYGMLVFLGCFTLYLVWLFADKKTLDRMRQRPWEAHLCGLLYVVMLAVCVGTTQLYWNQSAVTPSAAPLAKLAEEALEKTDRLPEVVKPKDEPGNKPELATREVKEKPEEAMAKKVEHQPLLKTEVDTGVDENWLKSPLYTGSLEQEAKDHEKAGHLEEAIKTLDEVARRYKLWKDLPGQAAVGLIFVRETLQKRAELHTKLGQHDKAVADWQELVDLHKDDDTLKWWVPDFFYNRAVSLQKAKRWHEASQEFRRMIDAGKPYPFDHEPCLRLAEIYADCPDPLLRDEQWAAKYRQMAALRKSEMEDWQLRLQWEPQNQSVTQP